MKKGGKKYSRGKVKGVVKEAFGGGEGEVIFGLEVWSCRWLGGVVCLGLVVVCSVYLYNWEGDFI